VADPSAPTGAESGPEREAVVVLLRVGLAASVLLMLIGIGLALGRGHLRAAAVPLRTVWPALRDGRPSGFLAAGVLVLVVTPFLRVLTLIVSFALDRDWRFVWVAVGVAAILALGIALGRV
jgi:uncharacterized membrane protein